LFWCGGLLAASLSLVALAQQPGGHGHDAHKESAEGKQVTVQGELIDTACFVSSEGEAKGQNHAECARECMGSGVPAGILPDGAKNASGMMFLLTNATVLAPHAGKTIKVEGKAYENMRAIDVQKLFVKDGEKWTEVQLKDAHHKMGEGGQDHGGHGDQKHGHK
jgi:hypothetical protein